MRLALPGVSRRSSWFGAALAGAVLALLTGCTGLIHGDWRLEKAIPNRETFSIDNATFRRDGTFEADVTIEGRSARERGTYDFNGFSLTLRPAGGGVRVYNAARNARTLDVMWDERKVILRKQ